jgi:hypothetical protein
MRSDLASRQPVTAAAGLCRRTGVQWDAAPIGHFFRFGEIGAEHYGSVIASARIGRKYHLPVEKRFVADEFEWLEQHFASRFATSPIGVTER